MLIDEANQRTFSSGHCIRKKNPVKRRKQINYRSFEFENVRVFLSLSVFCIFDISCLLVCVCKALRLFEIFLSAMYLMFSFSSTHDSNINNKICLIADWQHLFWLNYNIRNR